MRPRLNCGIGPVAGTRFARRHRRLEVPELSKLGANRTFGRVGSGRETNSAIIGAVLGPVVGLKTSFVVVIDSAASYKPWSARHSMGGSAVGLQATGGPGSCARSNSRMSDENFDQKGCAR